MSYLQAFNFSNPFSVPNFNPFGAGTGLPALGSSLQSPFGTQSPAGTTYTRTASNQLLLNQNPQSPAAAAAANLQIPESIVPNYNPNAATDYYGNPNQNYANQQAPIPQQYQQQQPQQQIQQQFQQQQQQFQQQQQQLQQQQQQQQAQAQVQLHTTQIELRPQVVQAIPDSSEVQDRGANKDGFDVIIHDGNSDNQSAEQLTELEQQELLSRPPTARTGRRKKQRNPPRVVNYAPVHQVHYVPPAGIGPHFVSFHPKQKFSVHDVIEDHSGSSNQIRLNNPNSNNVPNANIVDPNDNAANPAPRVGNDNNVQPPTTSNLGIQNGNNVAPPPNFPQNNVQNAPNVDADVINADSVNPPTNLNNPPPTPQLQNNQRVQDNVNSAGEARAGAPPAPEPRQKGNGEEKHKEKLRVTPIQGPIFAKDGMVPVVPLYSYPSVKNGTYYQIPILWTALSYALGLEIHGEILRGLPCIKRLNQLYCPTAGQTYPREQIEGFIDDNKALIRRMYGEFIMSSEAYTGPPGGNSLRRVTREIFEDEVPDLFPDSKHSKKHRSKRTASAHHHDDHNDFDDLDDGHIGNGTLKAHIRATRQTVNNRNGGPSQQPRSNRVDSCESTVEIVTPYWAANSGGKVRAIVNTQHFEQAIHQEVCRHTSTRRCSGECGCEQKYKWHRLLAYDPDNDCRGIFMDWFLFPSCCVCRCNPQ